MKKTNIIEVEEIPDPFLNEEVVVEEVKQKKTRAKRKTSSEVQALHSARQDIEVVNDKNGKPSALLYSYSCVAKDFMLRSAIFGISKRDTQKVVVFSDQDVRVQAMTQYAILIKGPTLNQFDFDVMQAFLSNVFRKDTYTLSSILSVQEVCDFLGMKKGGQQQKLINESLKRLCETHVSAIYSCGSFGGSLIHQNINETKNYFRVSIDQDFYNLFFNDEDFTYLNVNYRNSLSRPLTKWLYNFLSSHTNDFCFSHREIWRLSGSEFDFDNNDQAKKNFTFRLRQSLKELSDVFTFDMSEDKNYNVKVLKRKNVNEIEKLINPKNNEVKLAIAQAKQIKQEKVAEQKNVVEEPKKKWVDVNEQAAQLAREQRSRLVL